MQGVSAYIETHYEAMAYYQQEKKICHYRQYGECTNLSSIQYDKECIGYTKCADFISDARYNEKQAKKSREMLKRKRNKSKAVEKQISATAPVHHPTFKSIFEQFKNQ